MSVRLVILGFLREQPLYGYEIKQIIEEHMGDWTSIAFGSIYFALDKLAQENFIVKAGTEQEGNRPSRSVYEITPAGKTEFIRLLRELWRQDERQYFDLDLGLFFMHSLPQEEIIGYLEQRVFQLQAVVDHLLAHRTEQLSIPEVPPLAAVIFDHTLVHTQAELSWTSELLRKLQTGEFK